MNKIQHKFLHFRTRLDFENNKDLISDSSIAFIDEGKVIYTHGIEYSADTIQGLIDRLNDDLQSTLDELSGRIDEKASELQLYANEKGQEAIADAQNRLASATEEINRLKNELDDIKNSTKWDEQDGRIALALLGVNEIRTAVTSINEEIDAINGIMVTQATLNNLLDEILTNYTNAINLLEGTINLRFNSINTQEDIDTEIGYQMSLPNGLFSQYVTYTDLSNDEGNILTNRVETVLNGKQPSWSAMASSIETVLNSQTSISSRVSSLELLPNQISLLSTAVNQNTESIAGLTTDISDLQSSTVLTAQKIYDALDGQDGRTVAAKIFLLANEQGSNIVLSADRIEALGTFIAQQIAAASITADSVEVGTTGAKILINNNGMYHDAGSGRSAFRFNTDGTGYIGYAGSSGTSKALYWGNDGVLHINSAIIEGQVSVDPNQEVLQYDDTAIQQDIADLQSWITARAYLTNAGIIFDNQLNGNKVELSTDKGLKHTVTDNNNEQHSYWLKNDGTGQFGYGKISWDANGTLTVDGVSITNSTVDGYATTTQLGTVNSSITSINTALNNLGTWTNGQTLVQYIQSLISAAQLGGATVQDIQTTVDAYLLQQNFLTSSDLTGYATTSDVSTAISNLNLNNYVQKDNIVVDLNAKLRTDQNIDNSFSIASAITGWERKTGYFTETTNGNTTIVGLSSSVDISSKIQDYLTNDVAYSGLNTWMNNIKGSYTGGFTLATFINRAAGLTGNDALTDADVAASIIGEVNDNNSTIRIQADKVVISGSGTQADPWVTVDDQLTTINNSVFVNGQVTANQLEAKGTSEYPKVYIDKDGIDIKQSANSTSIHLDKDGSGYFANNSLHWDTNGNIVANNANFSTEQVFGNTTISSKGIILRCEDISYTPAFSVYLPSEYDGYGIGEVYKEANTNDLYEYSSEVPSGTYTRETKRAFLRIRADVYMNGMFTGKCNLNYIVYPDTVENNGQTEYHVNNINLGVYAILKLILSAFKGLSSILLTQLIGTYGTDYTDNTNVSIYTSPFYLTSYVASYNNSNMEYHDNNTTTPVNIGTWWYETTVVTTTLSSTTLWFGKWGDVQARVINNS